MPGLDLYKIHNLDRKQPSPSLASQLTVQLDAAPQNDPVARGRIETARMILGDPARRARYDAQLADPAAPPVTEDTLIQISGRSVPAAHPAPKPSGGGVTTLNPRILGTVAAALAVLLIAVIALISCGGDGGGGSVAQQEDSAAGSASSDDAEAGSTTAVPELTYKRTPAQYADLKTKAASIPTKEKTEAPGFRPGMYGSSTSDCPTYEVVLQRDLTNRTIRGSNECATSGGQLLDPYTGKTIEYERPSSGRQEDNTTIRVDSVVSPQDGWNSGGAKKSSWRTNGDDGTGMTAETFGDDTRNLLAVSAGAFADKNGRDASEWMPANAAYHCDYAATITEIKYDYGLFFSPAERGVVLKALDTCPTTGA